MSTEPTEDELAAGEGESAFEVEPPSSPSPPAAPPRPRRPERDRRPILVFLADVTPKSAAGLRDHLRTATGGRRSIRIVLDPTAAEPRVKEGDDDASDELRLTVEAFLTTPSVPPTPPPQG